MLIGGLERLSLLDFPNCLSAIVFTQGCNFRCHFCYNPMLVWPAIDRTGVNQSGQSLIAEADLFDFLKSRVGKLDGVVITGGEPTLHHDLPEFISRVRALGYAIKLDTNGTNPEMLTRLLADNLLDYIAMDIKAPWAGYRDIVGTEIDDHKLKTSVAIIAAVGMPHEFRSTLAPAWHDKRAVEAMAEQIPVDAVWYLQKFLGDRDLVNADYVNARSFTDAEMSELLAVAKKSRAGARLRGL